MINPAKLGLSIPLCAVLAAAQPPVPVRWACIGNSITQGPSPTAAYAAKLGTLLGPGYVVENDGVSGRTLLKNGDFPYWTQGKLAQVFALKPDIVTIKLGTNDSKPVNWDAHKGEFEGDLIALIDTLQGMPSKPTVWLVIPCPGFVDQSGSAGIRGTVLKNEIIPIIKKVAAAKGLNTIDAYTPMLAHRDLFSDGIHPNAEGHDSLAAIFYRTYLSKTNRIACIGNSITEYAFGTPGTVAKDAYPIKLGELLGKSWYAVNKGKSGAYMQKVSAFPYWNTGLIKSVIDFKPITITLMLGTNDARAQAWNKDKYIADYNAMLDTLSTISPKPKIWLCLPCPAWKRNGEWQYQGISGDLIRDEVIPAIKQVAKARSLNTIDLYAPMLPHESLVPDGVHPNADGQDSMAHWIQRALTEPVTAIQSARGSVLYPEIDLAHGNLSVTLPGSEGGQALLYSPSGRLEATMVLRPGMAATLSLQGLTPGRYFLSVETPAGRSVKSLLLQPLAMP